MMDKIVRLAAVLVSGFAIGVYIVQAIALILTW
jgi:hypothetical protein